jgi:hypothetical protein
MLRRIPAAFSSDLCLRYVVQEGVWVEQKEVVVQYSLPYPGAEVLGVSITRITVSWTLFNLPWPHSLLNF